MGLFDGVKAVFFDIGETLIREERMWANAARVLRVNELDVFATLGALISQRRSHDELFARFDRGDMNLDRALQLHNEVTGESDLIETDLYADARATLAVLKERGYFVGIAANQPARREAILHSWALPVDMLITSETLGVEKPDPRFFEALPALANCSASEIAYVGDRVDNDMLPALKVGMRAVLLTRGPWGRIQSEWPEAVLATATVTTLDAIVPHFTLDLTQEHERKHESRGLHRAL